MILDGWTAGLAGLIARIHALARPRRTTPKTPELAALGRALQRLRTDRGLTQRQLAKRAGHNDSARIGKIETGQLNPTYLSLRQLCAGLRISLEHLGREVEREYKSAKKAKKAGRTRTR